MHLLKCHGSSNDFFIIDESIDPLDEYDRSALTRALCDREGGFGADGILFVESQDEHFGMRILNADGGEAEMCGNGLRCVARYASERINSDTVAIRTMKETIPVARVHALGPGVSTFRYESAAFSFDVDSLPMRYAEPRAVMVSIPEISGDRKFTAISAPNPHLVAVVDEIDVAELERVGANAQRTIDVFPAGVNVSFVKLLDPTSVYVVTFERGVGLTEACGTAMSAACVVATSLGLVAADRSVDVLTLGGLVRCLVRTRDDKWTASVEGNATFTYAVTVDPEGVLKGGEVSNDRTVFMNEIEAYDQFLAGVRRRLNPV